MLLGVARCADWNSRLSRWNPHGANEKSEQVFSNQALNTLDSYAGRSLGSLDTTWKIRFVSERVKSGCVQPVDARSLRSIADIWLTDLPALRRYRLHGIDHTRLRRGGLAGGHALRVRHAGSGGQRATEQPVALPAAHLDAHEEPCCSPPPRRYNCIPSRRSTSWRRWRRVRTRCWVPPAAAGVSGSRPSTCCWAKPRCRPGSTSVGTGCAIRCRRARKGRTFRFYATRCRCRTRMPTRWGARWTSCARRTDSASRMDSGGSSSITTHTFAASSCVPASTSKRRPIRRPASPT